MTNILSYVFGNDHGSAGVAIVSGDAGGFEYIKEPLEPCEIESAVSAYINNDENVDDDERAQLMEDLAKNIDEIHSTHISCFAETELHERTICSITYYVFNVGDDSDETTQEFAAHLEGVLKTRFGDDVDIDVNYSNSFRYPNFEIVFEDIDEDDKDQYQDEDDEIASIKSDIEDIAAYELENFNEEYTE
jgi:hypothetical protein